MPEPLATVDLSRRRVVPAWGLSAASHVLLVLWLGFVLRHPVGLQEPPPRQVGIVLRPVGPDRPERYVREIPGESASEATRSEESRLASQERDFAEDLLPSGDAAADHVLREIQLPGTGTPTPSIEGLLPELHVRPGHQRPLLPAGDEQSILAEEAASRAAKQALGLATEISLFGSPAARGRSFVFAIDRSGSMGGDGLNVLAAARAELSHRLAHLTETHRFQIVAYHHQCVWLGSPRLLPASEENKAAVGPFLDNLASFGGTGHEAALRFALSMEPDAIFLLTDGGDPYLNEVQLANLRRLAAKRTSIHTIQFGFHAADGGQDFLRQLAAQNGGSYSYVDMAARRAP
jgi:hypothetical protein